MKQLTNKLISYLFLYFLIRCIPTVKAEIALDGTLGRPGPLAGPHFDIQPEYGQARGENLFHSFQQFNINAGQSVSFLGKGFTNVISRVTGGEKSTISGLLQSEIPNVFLLNPAGILFGKGATLDVPGIFHASTADYLQVGKAERFYVARSAQSVLSVASPTAFGFLDSKPIASVTLLEDSKLTLPDNRRLSIVAGDITMEKHSALLVPNGHLALTSVASPGEVNVNPDEVNLNNFTQLGKITISNSAIVGNEEEVDNPATVFNGAQSIFIRGGQFVLEGGIVNARVKDRTSGTSNIEITTRGDTTLKQNAVISTESYSPVNAGNVTIRANNLTMSDQAIIKSDSQAKDSAAGRIKITADNQVTMTDNATIQSNTNQGGAGGHIEIEARSLQMHGTFGRSDNGAMINATSRGTTYPAGQVSITAEEMQMSGDATINTGTYTSLLSSESGAGGSVTIKAHSLAMTDTAFIISSSFNDKDSGSLAIDVNDLTLSKQSALAATTFSAGKGGNVGISIHNSLSLSDNAVIISGTEGRGAGGNVALFIQANRVAIGNSTGISSESGMNNVFIQAIHRRLKEAEQRGAFVDEEIFAGGGEAGNVYIQMNKLSLTQGRNWEDTKIQFSLCGSRFPLGRRLGLAKAFNFL